MSEGTLYADLNDPNHHGIDDGSGAPLTGADGQPLLAMVGDLGAAVVSGAAASTGGSSGSAVSSPISASSSNLVINVTYDQATSSLPSGFVAAVNDVVTYYESLFTTATPTTVNIDLGYGEIAGQSLGAGALGESETYLGAYTYSSIKSALASVDSGAAASMPASQPVSGTMWLATAEAKALGLTPAQPSTSIDGYVGLSSSLPFTYDPNNRAVAGNYDFIGVVEHEFSEVMGRIDLFGYSIDGITPGYSLLDMFHYTASGVHTYTGTTTNYFSVDGGASNLDYFNTNASGDSGDWAGSAGADAYLAFSPSGQADLISQADIAAMHALGFAAPVNVIESAGATALAEYQDHYYLGDVNGVLGPALTYNAVPVTADAMGGWNAIGADATNGGYEIAWQYGTSDLYTIWSTDSHGNFVSDTVGNVAGASTAVEMAEYTLNQDLNHDGTIGIPLTTIQTDGTTSLVEGNGGYYLDTVGVSALGPSLKYGGTPLFSGSIGGWNPVGAVASGGGYEVVWQHGTDSLFTLWNVDSNGNYVSDTVGNLAGTNLTLEAAETSFNQDLNHDGTIGIPVNTVQTDGSTTLVEFGGNFYLDATGNGALGPELNYAGTPLVDGMIGGWNPIGAVSVSGGYEIAWQHGSDDLFTIWNTNSSATFVSDSVGNLSGSSMVLQNAEITFNQDLNHDGTIGIPTSLIQTDNSTSLVESGGNYYLNTVGVSGLGPELKYGTTPLTAGSVGGWNPVGAVAVSGGYEVAWQHGTDDLYTIWNTDTSATFVSDTIGNVAGASAALESAESTFNQDINHDGTIGVPTTTGATSTALATDPCLHLTEAPILGVAPAAAIHDHI